MTDIRRLVHIIEGVTTDFVEMADSGDIEPDDERIDALRRAASTLTVQDARLEAKDAALGILDALITRQAAMIDAMTTALARSHGSEAVVRIAYGLPVRAES